MLPGNFQCQCVLLIWIVVGHGLVFLLPAISIYCLLLSGRRPDIDRNTVRNSCCCCCCYVPILITTFPPNLSGTYPWPQYEAPCDSPSLK